MNFRLERADFGFRVASCRATTTGVVSDYQPSILRLEPPTGYRLPPHRLLIRVQIHLLQSHRPAVQVALYDARRFRVARHGPNRFQQFFQT